jgi:predicted Zn-dependent protease with MMP-like domain
MERRAFELLVERAIAGLPEEFRDKLENLDVVVEDRPMLSQLDDMELQRGETLLGLYEGVPQTRRGRSYGLVPPDKITIFQKPIEVKCRRDNTDIAGEVQRVIQHEIAHHFGIGEARLREIEEEKGG